MRHLRTSRQQLRYVQIDWIELSRPYTVPLWMQVAEIQRKAQECGTVFEVDYVGVSPAALDRIAMVLGEKPVTLQRVMEMTGFSKPTVTVGLRVLGERGICIRTPGKKTRWEYSKDE